jgi:tRNA(Ile)-lysidine synthase
MAAAGRPVADGEPLAIAVSGGPDSIGLLAAAAAAFPGRVAALTVDHGLRAASAAEAALVAEQCAARGIPHHVLLWTGGKPSADLQSAARTARYRLMLGWCRANGVPMLLTAHHLEDQAETLLMRIARGSGSAGLAGVRRLRRQGGVDIVRPALSLPRATLAQWAEGWTTIDDPSNADERFARTAVRRLLQREGTLLPAAALATTAAHLVAVEDALLWVADQAWEGRVRHDACALWLDAAGLPDELRRRLTRRAIASLAPDSAVREAAIMRLMARLDSGQSVTLAGVKAQRMCSREPLWRFRMAPKRRIPAQK